ncbi:hypothetical protein DICA2_F06898 [Diutina catenulata]
MPPSASPLLKILVMSAINAGLKEQEPENRASFKLGEFVATVEKLRDKLNLPRKFVVDVRAMVDFLRSFEFMEVNGDLIGVDCRHESIADEIKRTSLENVMLYVTNEIEKYGAEAAEEAGAGSLAEAVADGQHIEIVDEIIVNENVNNSSGEIPVVEVVEKTEDVVLEETEEEKVEETLEADAAEKSAADGIVPSTTTESVAVPVLQPVEGDEVAMEIDSIDDKTKAIEERAPVESPSPESIAPREDIVGTKTEDSDTVAQIEEEKEEPHTKEPEAEQDPELSVEPNEVKKTDTTESEAPTETTIKSETAGNEVDESDAAPEEEEDDGDEGVEDEDDQQVPISDHKDDESLEEKQVSEEPKPTSPAASEIDDDEDDDQKTEESTVITKSDVEGNGNAKSRKRKRDDDSEIDDDTKPDSKRSKAPLSPAQYKRFQQVAINLISYIQQHRFSSPFLQPVKRSEASEYNDIVHHPRDLKSMMKAVKSKQHSPVYTSVKQLQRDVMLMFANCIMYNRSDDDLYKLTTSMRQDVNDNMPMFKEAEDEIRNE